MQKVYISKITILLAFLLIFVLIYAGCNSGEITQNDVPAVTTSMTSEATRNTPDEVTMETEFSQSYDSVVTEESSANVADDEVVEEIESNDVSDKTEDSDYDNGIELPDHNWN